MPFADLHVQLRTDREKDFVEHRRQLEALAAAVSEDDRVYSVQITNEPAPEFRDGEADG